VVTDPQTHTQTDRTDYWAAIASAQCNKDDDDEDDEAGSFASFRCQVSSRCCVPKEKHYNRLTFHEVIQGKKNVDLNFGDHIFYFIYLFTQKMTIVTSVTKVPVHELDKKANKQVQLPVINLYIHNTSKFARASQEY